MDSSGPKEPRNESLTRERWSGDRREYACTDTTKISIRRERMVFWADPLPKTVICYAKNFWSKGLWAMCVVSGTKFGRDLAVIFRDMDQNRTFVCPDSVRVVRSNAFEDAMHTRSVVLNRGLEKLWWDAFRNARLRKITIPAGLKTLGSFYLCSRLRRVVFEEDSQLEEILPNCFAWSGLEEITIPRSVRVLGHAAFQKCDNLKRVSFQAGSRLETIGDQCFANSGLEEFRAPPALKCIKTFAFYGCKSLKRVVLNEGLEVLGRGGRQNETFETLAERVRLPKSLKETNIAVFAKCENLREITVESALMRKRARYIYTKY